MLRPYLKIWEWEWIFGCSVKAISCPGVSSPCFVRIQYLFPLLQTNKQTNTILNLLQNPQLLPLYQSENKPGRQLATERQPAPIWRVVFHVVHNTVSWFFSKLSWKSGFPPFRNLTFWKKTFQHGHLINGRLQHVYVSAMWTCAKMSLCQKVLVSKHKWRQNVRVPVRPQGRNLEVSKCLCDEMSVPKCLLSKCRVPKWW